MDPPVDLLDEPNFSIRSVIQKPRWWNNFTDLARKEKTVILHHTPQQLQKQCRRYYWNTKQRCTRKEVLSVRALIELQIWHLELPYFHSYFNWPWKLKGIPREKQIALGNIRMTISARTCCICLTYLFENSNPFDTSALITSITELCNLYYV